MFPLASCLYEYNNNNIMRTCDSKWAGEKIDALTLNDSLYRFSCQGKKKLEVLWKFSILFNSTFHNLYRMPCPRVTIAQIQFHLIRPKSNLQSSFFPNIFSIICGQKSQILIYWMDLENNFFRCRIAQHRIAR